MITFDFFNDSSTELVEKFCEYFQLDKETVEDYFIRVNPDTLSIYFYNAEEYGSLLAGNSVPPEALKVLEVKENDLVEVALSK